MIRTLGFHLCFWKIFVLWHPVQVLCVIFQSFVLNNQSDENNAAQRSTHSSPHINISIVHRINTTAAQVKHNFINTQKLLAVRLLPAAPSHSDVLHTQVPPCSLTCWESYCMGLQIAIYHRCFELFLKSISQAKHLVCFATIYWCQIYFVITVLQTHPSSLVLFTFLTSCIPDKKMQLICTMTLIWPSLNFSMYCSMLHYL